MQIAIFIACCFIIGMLIVVCLELSDICNELAEIRVRCGSLGNQLIEYYINILTSMPNTFEYNGMRGKVFKK